MAARRARIELMLEWYEKHPEVVRKAEEKLRSLIGTYGTAVRRIKETITDTRRLEHALKIAEDLYKEKKVAILTTSKSAKFMNEVLRRLTEQEEVVARRHQDTAHRLRNLGRSVTRIGYRMGWFAFRTMVVGRILLNWMMRPVRKAIAVLRDWESSIDLVASTLGLLAASGQLTTERSTLLKDTLVKLAEIGPKVQGAFQYLQSIFIDVALEAIQPFLPWIFKLGDALLALWEKVEPVLIPALEDLADRIFPVLIDLIEDIGPAIIEGFVAGLSIAIPLIVDALRFLSPILPLIAQIIGLLLPFAPILVAIGAAFYILSPIITAIGMGLTFLAFILGKVGIIGTTVAPIITTLGSAIGAAGAAAAPAIPVILALGAAILLAGAGFTLAGLGVKFAAEGLVFLLASLMDLAPAIPFLFKAASGLFAVAAAGITLIPAMIGLIGASAGLFAFAAGLMALTASIWALIPALKALQEVSDMLGGILSGLGGILGALCFKHAARDAQAFTRDLMRLNTELIRTRRDVEGLGGALEAGMGAGGAVFGGGRQDVTIYADINIGAVAREDIDEVVDAVNRGMTEALRRRYLA